MVTSIVVVGVGGQGVVTLARWLGRAAMAAGYDVRIAETHGLSQRGGSVEAHVRFGEVVRSPTVSEADADYVVALEALEALRAFKYLKSDALMVVNKRIINVPGKSVDSTAVFNALVSLKNVKLIPAFDIAQRLGGSTYENAVMFGYMAALLGLDRAVDWLDGGNLRAFNEGKKLISFENIH